MKVVVAPDSFKGNLSAELVCQMLSQGVHDADPGAEVISLPLADGGEGTARAITTSARGVFRTAKVKGPLGDVVEAEYGLIRDGKTAVMDMASASGIELISAEKLDPLKASTWGTGELILAALDAGVEEVLLGIGGSATVDGGAGMAMALGFGLLDAQGKPIPLGGEGLSVLDRIETGGVDKRLSSISFLVACDVTNPLLGPKGAVRVFGPQKGATAATMPVLEAGLERLLGAWIKAGLATDSPEAGDGAAGGLGAALRVLLKAKMCSGARTVMEYAGFEAAVKGADLVITGEGMTDSQTAGGKLCSVVAAECRRLKVPVALISGALGGDVLSLFKLFDVAMSDSCGQTSLDAMIRSAPRDLRFAASNLIRIWKLGKGS